MASIEQNTNAPEVGNVPSVIWITGYSGSGKTTVGRKLKFRLRELGVVTVFLDGDDLRGIFGGRWGYGRDERIELARSYFRLANTLVAQGITVVISAVAMFEDVYSWIKTNVDRSLVAYLDVPKEERLSRDRSTKNLYGEIGDISRLYDSPGFADLVVDNSSAFTPDISAERILAAYAKSLDRQHADKGREEHWNRYYSDVRSIPEPSSFARLVAEQIKPGAKLLEIGCGNGRDAFFFGKFGCRVTALDPSRAAIDFCKSRPEATGIDFLQGTAAELDTGRDGSYDVVYSRFCLHAMTEAEEVETLQAVNRLMRSGGTLFIECRSINDPLARKGEVLSPTERIHGHYRRFIILDELKARLEKSGFAIIRAQESNNVAAIEGDNPVVIRLAATRR